MVRKMVVGTSNSKYMNTIEKESFLSEYKQQLKEELKEELMEEIKQSIANLKIGITAEDKKSWPATKRRDSEFDELISVIRTNRFTGDSVKGLDLILQEEKKKKKKKLAYFLCNLTTTEYGWATIDVNYGLDCKQVSISFSEDSYKNYPCDLRRSCEPGAVSWGSKLVIVGGIDRNMNSSDKVFIYDTTSKEWEQWDPQRHQMKNARCCSPIVVVIDNKIYVFGGYGPAGEPDMYDDMEDEEMFNVDHWAEVYDDKTWDYLPYPPPVSLVRSRFTIYSHFVHNKRLFFWVPNTGIYIYDFGSKQWTEQKIDELLMLCYPQSNFPREHPLSISLRQGPIWSSRVAVVGDFVFWHFFGTIYGHDLNTDTTLPLHCVKDRFGGQQGGFLLPPSPTYLVYVGNGILCLFSKHRESRNSGFPVWYHTFLIETTLSNGKSSLSLVEKDSGLGDIDIFVISAVMEVEV